MKTFVNPDITFLSVSCQDLVCSSGSQSISTLGTVEEREKLPLEDTAFFDKEPSSNPPIIKRIMPMFSKYNSLDNDIKSELNKYRIARVFRSFPFSPVSPYIGFIEVERINDDECFVTYFIINNSNHLLILFNIEDLVENILVQIRTKINGEYSYKLTKEVRKKMPVFCKLMDNCGTQKVSVPFITFVDDERRHPLLAVYFSPDQIEKSKGLWIQQYDLASFTVDLVKEVDKAGLLDQSKEKILDFAISSLALIKRLNNIM